MALKNQQPQESISPEQEAAAAAAPADAPATTTEEAPVVETEQPATTEAVGEVAPAPAPPQEEQAPPAVVEDDREESNVPLVLLGTRKGFPNTAVGNFNLISDVVTELYNKGVLVINVDGDESSVFFDSSKL